jgi:exo-beta-1,3-glucanase (GH17 family)
MTQSDQISKNSKSIICLFFIWSVLLIFTSCKQDKVELDLVQSITAESILGDSTYLAISYGGYRTISRDTQPSIQDLKEDMLLLSSLGIKLLRTYNVQRKHASNVLQAITELKEENNAFEMYVMLGAWIDCKNAWTDLEPDHNIESEENASEIDRAVKLANLYPDIVKIIAVGNEAMVKWAAPYYVQPGVILKWVNHLQDLKSKRKLNEDLWITSSDNFASWGGGSEEYHVEDLNKLIKAVDFISMHTYPMHDTHYNPEFWHASNGDSGSDMDQINAAMLRAKSYAQSQYKSVFEYMKSIGVDKPIHIGETGWASHSDGFYGKDGSRACDEYKQALYHNHMRKWTNNAGLSCFFFQAIDEPWKDANNPNGSENHFGLFTVDGKAKYVIWDQVEEGAFEGLSRGGNEIEKTFGGDETMMMKTIYNPLLTKEQIIK